MVAFMHAIGQDVSDLVDELLYRNDESPVPDPKVIRAVVKRIRESHKYRAYLKSHRINQTLR